MLEEAGLQTDFPRVRRLRFQVVDRIDHLTLPLLRRIVPLVLRIGNVAEERNTDRGERAAYFQVVNGLWQLDRLRDNPRAAH